MEVPNSPPFIANGINNPTNKKTYVFKKSFAFNFEAKLLQIQNLKEKGYEIGEVKTWIHTLPWQFIYFYLTPKEFHDIQSCNHTAKVKEVKLEIFNLGNRTPFVTSARTVSYANANSQTTIGVWEKMEELGPFKCGNNIQHKQLYGVSYQYNNNFKNASSMRNVHYHDHGAAQQPLFVDNRGSYLIHTGQVVQGMLAPLNDAKYFLPPLMGTAKVLYNATNSIGKIYEKTYTPIDGTFHKFNNGINHIGTVPRVQNPLEQINAETGRITQAPLSRVGVLSQSRYSTTTIDNLEFSPIQGSPQEKILHSLGIGIVPLINPDNKLEISVLSIIIHTHITIEAESHGTNVIMDYNTYPQPNTYKIAYKTQANQFTNIYGMAGLPVVNYYQEGLEADDDDNPGIIPENRYSMSWGNGVVHTLRPDQIPGQHRVTGKMGMEQRIEIFKLNREVRKEYISGMRSNGTTINIIENAENAQYACPKGNGWNIPPSNDPFWTKLRKVGNKDANLTEADKKFIPPATQEQSSNFSGTNEYSTITEVNIHHPEVYE